MFKTSKMRASVFELEERMLEETFSNYLKLRQCLLFSFTSIVKSKMDMSTSVKHTSLFCRRVTRPKKVLYDFLLTMKPSFLTNASKDALFMKYSRRENENEMEKQKKCFLKNLTF